MDRKNNNARSAGKRAKKAGPAANNAALMDEVVTFATTMRNMERALPSDPYTFPNTVAHSSSFDSSGSTYAERIVSRAESGPEVKWLSMTETTHS
jgi:hypothetical protein